jgi:hypothetical protein
MCRWRFRALPWERRTGFSLFICRLRFSGLISLVLPLINPNVHYVFLKWIDNWGATMAWVIRGGIALLGLALWLGFKNRD